jgi:hypothetical protein
MAKATPANIRRRLARIEETAHDLDEMLERYNPKGRFVTGWRLASAWAPDVERKARMYRGLLSQSR